MSLWNKITDLQKLKAAWERVRKNHPAPGVDHITEEQFEQCLRQELSALQAEMNNGKYHPRPVRQAVILQKGKERTISLFCMRDKVVQQSLALELSRIYENRFPECTYAYRANRSALTAVNDIEKTIQAGQVSCILKLDIRSFFDSIRWDILEGILRERITEEPVMRLLYENACADILAESGNVEKLSRGIHQGSAIAPVLSNIYLLDFDLWAKERSDFYARYSDDMLVLGRSMEELERFREESEVKISEKGLRFHKEKSVLCRLSEGTVFLGYRFDTRGKSIPVKAEQSLSERLEELWFLDDGLTPRQKAEKAGEILGGWEQYYRGDRKPGSIIEYAALLLSRKGDGLQRSALPALREGLENDYHDIMLLLAEAWRDKNIPYMELKEYELFYRVPERSSDDPEKTAGASLLPLYRSFAVTETVDVAVELMQAYTDLGLYESGKHWMKEAERLRDNSPKLNLAEEAAQTLGTGGAGFSVNVNFQPVLKSGAAEKLLSAFAGREDLYSIDNPGNQLGRRFSPVMQPLTAKQVMQHLGGGTAVGTFIQRSNSTVRFLVVDLDVSKKILLQYELSSETGTAYLRKALDCALHLKKLLRRMGIESSIEFTGHRGFHVWVLFEEWLPVRYANLLSDRIEQLLTKDPDITLEFFPNKTRIKPGKYGQIIRLPYGTHGKTGRYSFFLDESLQPVEDVAALCDSLPKVMLRTLKRALSSGIEECAASEVTRRNVGKNTTLPVNSVKEEAEEENGGNGICGSMPAKTRPEFKIEEYGSLPEGVKTTLAGCTLMQYLCEKARKTNYLSHFERQTLLYVFGHIGQDGKDFVHTVMSWTLNYQYHVTERFIRKIPEKPISCIKLRDQYKMITAELGCSCVFRRTKDCYPSPVLHAVSRSLNSEDTSAVTLPLSKALTKEREEKALSELNLNAKVQEVAKQLQELKKHRRKLDQSIRKTETELEKIFDAEQIEALELEIGLLVRRKNESGYEWVIEL